MGVTEERIERIKKHAETIEGLAGAAVSISSELDAVLRDNQQMGRQIERLNEANDRLRERLNRSESHDGYMKLPVDADGEPIRIGDVLYLPDSPGPIVVSGYERSTCSDEVYCIGHQDGRKSHFCPKLWTHKQPRPADSWEKLEEDAAKEVCAYAGAPFSIVDQDRYSCTGCRFDDCSNRKANCWLQMNSELMARAKRLAGAE